MTKYEGDDRVDKVFKAMYEMNDLLDAVNIINDLYEIGIQTKLGKIKYKQYLDGPPQGDEDDSEGTA